MVPPLHEVAFTSGALTQAKAEGMTEDDLKAVEDILSKDPEAGDLIAGSGGCRKVRVAGRGKGKSGGYRVITYLPSRVWPVYVFAVLSKGSRANFSDAEVAAMATLAKNYKEISRLRAVR